MKLVQTSEIYTAPIRQHWLVCCKLLSDPYCQSTCLCHSFWERLLDFRSCWTVFIQWTKTSPWVKQLTWLRIVQSGDWCLHLALHTSSSACQKWTNECPYAVPHVDITDHTAQKQVCKSWIDTHLSSDADLILQLLQPLSIHCA